MITVAKATSAGYYTDGNGGDGDFESYYLDAVTQGEPPGRWLGRGAEQLGLYGTVEAKIMNTLYDDFMTPFTGDPLGNRPAQRRSVDDRLADALASEPDALPERVAELRHGFERAERKNVIGWDATFNVAKSISVVHVAMHRAELTALREGDPERAEEYGRVRRGIEAAVLEANDTAMQILEQVTTARTGGGSGAPLQWVNADGVTIASFFQHTNRAIEPHLHVHNVLLNRVLCPDGEYRAVDGRDLLAQRFHFSAVGDRVLGEKLAEIGFGMQARADGMGREIPLVGPEIIAHYSTRRQQVTAATTTLVEVAEERLGRELTDVELYRLSRQATLATRAAKVHDGETADEMVDRWYADLVASTGRTLDSLAQTAMAAVRQGPVAAEEWSPSSVLAEAVAACAERSSTWGRANLINEIELRLPTLGLAADKVAPLLEQLADQALASEDVVQVTGLDEGPFAPPSATTYAAVGTLAAESALRQAGVTRGRLAADPDAVGAWLDAARPHLGADQRAAVLGVAGSDAALTVLVGPAGTGKSYTAGALAHAWHDTTGGRVLGLAVSQIATTVLTRRRHRRRRQHLRVPGRPRAPRHRIHRPRRHLLAARAVRRRHGRRGLDGRHQRSRTGPGPGRGGRRPAGPDRRPPPARRRRRRRGPGPARRARRDLLPQRGPPVRRRLGRPRLPGPARRRPRRPARPTTGTAGSCSTTTWTPLVDAAARAAVADRLDGRSTVVIAGTNAQAAQIASTIRDQLVALGLVEAGGVFLERDGGTAGVGDLVACRRNDYQLDVVNRAAVPGRRGAR